MCDKERKDKGEWKECPTCTGVGYIPTAPESQTKPWYPKELRCETCSGKGKII